MKTKFIGAAVGLGMMVGTLSGMTGVAHVGAAAGTGSAMTAASAMACDCEVRYTTTDLNLRSGPGTNHAVQLVIPSGAKVQVYLAADASQNGFVKVYYNDSTLGWVSAQYLTGSSGGSGGSGGSNGGGGSVPTVSDSQITGTAFTGADVNFRQGPGTSYGINFVIAKGSQVATTDVVQNGFRAIFHAGVQGWVIDGSLDKQGPSSPTADHGAYSKTGMGTTNAAVNFRSGPSTGHAVQWLLPAGTSVELTTATQDGFRLVFVNGTAGWVYESFITSAGAPSQGSGNIMKTLSGVNFRSGPSTGHSVYNVLPPGTTVKATGTVENGFRQVVFNGTTGWVHGDYLN